MKIGKIEITKTEHGYFLSNDGEGMEFNECELEEVLKDFLYKHF